MVGAVRPDGVGVRPHRFGIENPSVGLLSIGEEPGKGDTLRKEAFKLLSHAPGIRFIGNVEGRDVMRKTADVIVTDGFTGNVVLKALEGGLRVILNALLEAFAAEEHYKPHADALLPALLPLYAQLSPDTYGGAMLLGVDGVCIISHGSSNSQAMLNAIKLAHEMVEHHLVDEIRRGRSRSHRVSQGARLPHCSPRPLNHRECFISASRELTSPTGPLDRNEVFEIVRANLADILEIEPSTISEGQSFVDDLDADSLALIELVEALEEDLSERSVGFRIEDEDLVDLKTVRDAVDYVYDRVREA